jgi:uncharacterized protein (TIGR04255 family)
MYEQRNLIQIVMGGIGPQGIRSPTETPGRIHGFLSADRIWTVELSSDAISLSTRHYVRWEQFMLEKGAL